MLYVFHHKKKLNTLQDRRNPAVTFHQNKRESSVTTGWWRNPCPVSGVSHLILGLALAYRELIRTFFIQR